MAHNTPKNLKLYYSISEVAAQFGVAESLLRYWEKEFPSIKPKKTNRQVRQYSAQDIEEIDLIYNLVKVRGMKLSAAREVLKKNREGVARNTELINTLEGVRNELLSLRRELEDL
ncbi:MAG: MerR family transcriptional regulator [Bacteroidaceae bacterium]|nr:MerR family transcriptional regulator [Bacteroidaceae bacterium]MBR5883937.1 MerR family transcriptional regulator [Bacteroidaceae bacterium]